LRHAQSGASQQPAREHGFGERGGNRVSSRTDENGERVGHLQAGTARALGQQRRGVTRLGERAPEGLREFTGIGAAHGVRAAMLLEEALSRLADEIARLAHGNGILSWKADFDPGRTFRTFARRLRAALLVLGGRVWARFNAGGSSVCSAPRPRPPICSRKRTSGSALVTWAPTPCP